MLPSDSPVAIFADLATAFCSWCESESLGPDPELTAAVFLARMHAAALELPRPSFDSHELEPDIPPTDVAKVEKNLGHFAGLFYRVVFDPTFDKTDEPVMGDIVDDLLDTYCDVKQGCNAFRDGRRNDAHWQWSFSHRAHWSQHAVHALSALHWRWHDARPF